MFFYDWVDAVDSVMAGGLNDAGRGLNIAVVNPRTKDVIRVGHFDTFGSGFCQCIYELMTVASVASSLTVLFCCTL